MSEIPAFSVTGARFTMQSALTQIMLASLPAAPADTLAPRREPNVHEL